MTKMKLLSTLLLAYAVTGFAIADGFADKKQRIVDHVGERISILQTFQTCVQATEDKDGIKACRTTKKEAMKTLKESRSNT